MFFNLGKSKNTLRFKLMGEENEEYLEAANKNDLIEELTEHMES